MTPVLLVVIPAGNLLFVVAVVVAVGVAFVSEIGLDFSPGIQRPLKTRALAPGTSLAMRLKPQTCALTAVTYQRRHVEQSGTDGLGGVPAYA